MSSVNGNIVLSYLNPFSKEATRFDGNLDEDFILIYIDDADMPYLIRRCYLVNLTYDDIDYKCNETMTKINEKEQYYNLYKLFLNEPELRNIIISKNELDDIMNDSRIRTIRLYKTSKVKLTYPKLKYNLNNINVEDEDVKNEITDSLLYYIDTGGYALINGYLIRLHNEYPEKKRIPLDAETIRDLVVHNSNKFFFPCCYEKKCSRLYAFEAIPAMENLVKNIDIEDLYDYL